MTTVRPWLPVVVHLGLLYEARLHYARLRDSVYGLCSRCVRDQAGDWRLTFGDHTLAVPDGVLEALRDELLTPGGTAMAWMTGRLPVEIRAVRT
jgi:hypothetical protein